MAYTRTQTITNTPNTGTPFDQAYSSISDLFNSLNVHAGGEMGVGSFKIRSIDDAIKVYRPYDTSVSSFINMMGGSETVNNAVHEWAEDDAILPFDITGSASAEDATDVVNNVSGGNAYVPAATGVLLQVTAAEAAKARIFRKIRYSNASGGYTYAVITAIVDNDGEKALTLSSLDGTATLPLASAATCSVQVLEASIGVEFNSAVQPMGTNPTMEYTYLQKLEASASFTARAQNEANIFPQKERAMNQAMQDFNRQLETARVYGQRAKRSFTNADGKTETQYFAEGVYNTTKAQNYHTSDLTTGGEFDAVKFRNALYNFTKYNFSAESGGPSVRQMFIDGQFSNYLDRAFDEKQWFQGNTFVGGIQVSRFAMTDGTIDFVRNPFFEIQHPIPNASLRQSGTPKAFGILIPVQADTLTALTFNGEGVRDLEFKKQPDHVESYYKIMATLGLKHSLRQWSAVFEEV